MEHLGTALFGTVKSGDLLALFIRSRITAGSKHHGNSVFTAPLQFGLSQSAVNSFFQHIVPVTDKTAHHRLDLRITEANIEFQNFRLAVVDHDSAEDHTAEVEFFLIDTFEERLQNLSFDQLFNLFGHHRSR